ncbi:MAG: hypothetical protein ACK5Y2_05355 [Bdellovibrionales bacterium]
MRCRAALNWILILFVALTTASCSEFLNGRKKEEEVLRLSDAQFKCLDQVPDGFRQLLDETSTPQSLENHLECLASALDYFQEKTKGSHQSPDSYTVQNIRSFFGDFLGDRNRFSDEMAIQLMKLKAALFGGGESAITKNELTALVSFIRDLKSEVKFLRPSWNIILAKTSGTLPHPALDRAHWALRESVSRLLTKTQLPRADYSFEDFSNLLQEIDRFIRRSPGQRTMDLKGWLPLIRSIKENLFGEIVEMNSTARWKQALATMTDLHRLYLLYKYRLKSQVLFSREGLKTGDEMLVLLLDLLDRSWVLQKGELPFATTERLIFNLVERGLLSNAFPSPPNQSPKSREIFLTESVQALNEAYQALVRRVFERDHARPEDTVMGLERRHVRAIKLEYEIWKTAQEFISTLPDQFRYEQLVEKMNDYRPRAPSRYTDTNPNLILEGWKDFRGHITQYFPLHYLPSGDLIIGRNERGQKVWDWYSMSRLNVMRTLSRVLILGYSQNRAAKFSDMTINEDGMRLWYSDFEKLGLKIKAFDRRKPNAGTRSFFEADHFLFASNGNRSMSSQESFELINVIFAAGLGGAQELQASMKSRGCNLPGEKDVFDVPWSDEACFQRLLRADFSKIFRNLEGLSREVQKMSDAEWAEFYEALITFARNDEKEKGRVETADVRTLVVILHYIEMIFMKYDENQDELLSRTELLTLSERFVDFFKSMYDLNQPSKGETQSSWRAFLNWASTPFIRQGFACVVLTGELPSASNCGQSFAQGRAGGVEPQAARLSLLKTLNAFKASIR